ncbi:helix-turn-helix domain-containing protein [bacterium]|nr:helix-turn-helix domain-containing protein [bacterium]
MESNFGQEIRRLRLASGLSLRGLSARLHVSAAHLSDIEHGYRRPSDALLERIIYELSNVGSNATELMLMMTGLDETTRRWAATTPGVRALLHRCIATGQPPAELIRALDRIYPPPPGDPTKR